MLLLPVFFQLHLKNFYVIIDWLDTIVFPGRYIVISGTLGIERGAKQEQFKF